ncbi:hypothetical protein BCF55_1462 [Hydrogenivirga caldilitoris]|uniref:Uncharacterized protein n=1 Tax=Hydrogenivirga caldilitoris TaxID=246264 RepID=A0A497XSA0_9AQUI|nr:hypothetical protein [Hydrogenivirga caldilitoris]RLJ71164.1 hypothetical protein BCF55_1462 [Hydrogenivirga caldilitoris]
MNKRERAKELLGELLEKACQGLEQEEKDSKSLFFCRGELVGSVVQLGEDRLAVSVYSQKIDDPIHKEFLNRVKETFEGQILEHGTKLSSGVEQNFYYTYVHVKL